MPTQEFSYYQTRERDSRDDDSSLESSLTVPFVGAAISGDVQFGVKMRSKEKWNDEDRKETENNVAGLAFAQAIRDAGSDNFDILLGKRYRRDIFSSYGSVYASDPGFLSIPRRAYTADYDAEETIYAAYGMTSLSWGNSRMVVGARFERTEVDSEAWRFDRETDQAVRQSDSSRYRNVFPSAHFRQDLGNDMVLRAAYSTALNRPNLVDVVPSIEERDRGPGRREVTRGNPDLDPTYAHNFDVMFDYYLRPYGVVSAGVFYKRLKDVIFDVTGNRPFEGELWEMTSPENGDGGRAYGFELNWQQALTFLPAALDGFGVMINYTYTNSRADLPFGLGEVRLPGQSDRTYNVGLYYENAGFSGLLAYNKRSKFVDSVSLTSRELDVYWDERDQLDFTASYEVSNRFQVYGEASNLTDSRQNRFRGASSRVYEREGFGRFYQVGMRLSF
jgi:TonB-dependent receptor